MSLENNHQMIIVIFRVVCDCLNLDRLEIHNIDFRVLIKHKSQSHVGSDSVTTFTNASNVRHLDWISYPNMKCFLFHFASFTVSFGPPNT